jgi:hypothetical protein
MWVAKLLPKSVDNLERDFGKPVVVFGSKNFGRVDARLLLRIPPSSRENYFNDIDPDSLRLQEYMRNSFSGRQFVDIGRLLCSESSYRCRVYNSGGVPLTFDGGHLTPAGALVLGKAIANSGFYDSL